MKQASGWASGLAMLGAAALLGCGGGASDARKDQWDAFIYPDGVLAGSAVKIRGFVSLEACQLAAIERLQSMGRTGSGSYECGRNCRPYQGSHALDLCDETVD